MIRTRGLNMNKKQLITLFTILFLVLSLLTFGTHQISGLQVKTPPDIRDDAPTAIHLEEDAPPGYMDLYDIYSDTGALNFTLWSDSGWGKSFQNNYITVSIKSNDTLEFIPKQDKFGTSKLVVNATNADELSTQYNLTVIIAAVNDPPVIETIGNLKVSDTNSVTEFIYQNEWYNVTVTASDADDDTVIFLDNTTLFDINYLAGNISFKPAHDEVGNSYVKITASDINGSNCEDWVNIKFTILDVNDPPVAKIDYPENGSTLYNENYIVFEGDGFDPDLLFGDKLFFYWSSDIDGELGESQDISVDYLTPGTHEITLRVTDINGLYDEVTITIFVKNDKYEASYNVELSLKTDSLILKQGDSGVAELSVFNYGPAEDNITFEIKKYLDFEGAVELEPDNVTLKQRHSAIVNITVSVPAGSKMGFYLLEIKSKSSLKDENNGKKQKKDNDGEEKYNDPNGGYAWGYEDSKTIKIFVISDDPDDKNKHAEEPSWEVGYSWDYGLSINSESLVNNRINGTLNMRITNDTTLDVDDKEYDVFGMTFESDLAMDFDPTYGAYGEMKINMSGVSYCQKSDYATVLTEMKNKNSMKMGAEEYIYVTKIRNTYDPPINSYDFPIIPGEQWTVKTKIEQKTGYGREKGGYDDSDSYLETETVIMKTTVSYICLGTELITTSAGTFETYLVSVFDREIYYEYMDDNWEDEYRGTRSDIFDFEQMGVYNGYTLDYYSPEVGNTVKQVVYSEVNDYDYVNDTEEYYWDEVAAVELISYSLVKNDIDPGLNFDNETDSDNDTLPDDWEKEYGVEDPNSDDDKDGFSNFDEYQNGTDPTNPEDTPNNFIDLDNDGLPDSWEEYYGLNSSDPNDAESDLDNDGVTNIKEYQSRTSPANPKDFPTGEDNGDNRGEGGFELGKIGGIGLIYIIIFMCIILILIIFTLIVRRHKAEIKIRSQRAREDEPRVPEHVATDSSSIGHEIKRENMDDSALKRHEFYPPPPPPLQPPLQTTTYDKSEFSASKHNDYYNYDRNSGHDRHY